MEIFFNEDRADATSIAYPDYTLQDILYIVPSGLTAEDTSVADPMEEGTVYKITVLNTAVKDADADYTGPFGGTVQTGYKVSDILAAAGLEAANVDVQAISLGESTTTTIPFDQFTERYIVPTDSKDRGAYTVGRSQVYGDVTINVGCYVLGENALFYVPDSATEEAGLALTDVLARVGLTDIAAINIICSDGYSEVIDAADLDGVGIFHVDDRIDTNSVAYPQYTLQDVVTIEVLK